MTSKIIFVLMLFAGRAGAMQQSSLQATQETLAILMARVSALEEQNRRNQEALAQQATVAQQQAQQIAQQQASLTAHTNSAGLSRHTGGRGLF